MTPLAAAFVPQALRNLLIALNRTAGVPTAVNHRNLPLADKNLFNYPIVYMHGRHDFLLTPCSKDTFRIIYGDRNPHRGCFGNLAEALSPYGIGEDDIPVAFNVFMNVPVDAVTGELKVLPPKSRPGDHVTFEACEDLVIGMTACSALQSNNYAFKPIHYEILA